MRKTAVLFGVVGGVLIVALQLMQYRFLVIEHSFEIYGGLVAALFSALGIWLGLTLTRPRKTVIVREVAIPVEVRVPVYTTAPFAPDLAQLSRLGITPREHEILGLIAEGLSNREIAARLFVSENTVKTHSGRLFDKLNARRRTQAVQIGKEAGLLP
jgi:NarL family two-component system response regulator LiaR